MIVFYIYDINKYINIKGTIMAKQITIKKPAEFSIGVILNFVAIGAIITSVILWLLQTLNEQYQIELATKVAYIKDIAQFMFIGGLGALCIGAYTKNNKVYYVDNS